MPHQNFDNRLDLAKGQGLDIAAEATSEYARSAFYDELWRDPRRSRVSEEPVPSRGRLPIIVTIISVIIAVMALIGLREKIVRLAPAAATIYSAAGLPVNLAGLELRSLKSQLVLDGARKVLTIEGEIVNLRREANRVPPVALTVRGENGQNKYAWTTPAPKSRLEAGETIAFRARLASPPTDGADVVVRFASTEPTPSQSKTPVAMR